MTDLASHTVSIVACVAFDYLHINKKGKGACIWEIQYTMHIAYSILTIVGMLFTVIFFG
jgi:hypothetical protein